MADVGHRGGHAGSPWPCLTGLNHDRAESAWSELTCGFGPRREGTQAV